MIRRSPRPVAGQKRTVSRLPSNGCSRSEGAGGRSHADSAPKAQPFSTLSRLLLSFPTWMAPRSHGCSFMTPLLSHQPSSPPPQALGGKFLEFPLTQTIPSYPSSDRTHPSEPCRGTPCPSPVLVRLYDVDVPSPKSLCLSWTSPLYSCEGKGRRE